MAATAAKTKTRAAQMALDLRRDKNGQRRGGKRKGAGRKRIHFLASGKPLHRRVRRRPKVSSRTPVHVVLRVSEAVGRLRRRKAYHAIRLAILTAAVLGLIRVVHVSIQGNHIHLLVEAASEVALARGMKGLQVSAARRLNAAVTIERKLETPRRGQVFLTRYHAEIIRTPRQARHCLAYVLNNWRRHREDLSGAAQRRAHVDPYSSGIAFDGWHGITAPFTVPAWYQPLPVKAARSWLFKTGWRKHGDIGLHEVPGPAG
ncbi:MAG TPA: transposase [Kofleriaceae bacterium]|nr:transposase [Kofleriaceae bacterium]